MDGPNVNWKLLSSIMDERQSNDHYPELLDIGSCSLHVIHGALQKGIRETDWGIDLVLKALYNLFDKSPAKRENFAEITGTDVFPLLSVAIGGLKIRGLLIGLRKFGLTLQNTSLRH